MTMYKKIELIIKALKVLAESMKDFDRKPEDEESFEYYKSKEEEMKKKLLEFQQIVSEIKP